MPTSVIAAVQRVFSLPCRRYTQQWRFRAGAGGGGAQTPKSWLAPPPNLAVLLTRCRRLILRKISKFDATRCQILRLKSTKFDFRWGSAGGAYSATQTPLAVFKGPTCKGKAGEEGE